MSVINQVSHLFFDGRDFVKAFPSQWVDGDGDGRGLGQVRAAQGRPARGRAGYISVRDMQQDLRK